MNQPPHPGIAAQDGLLLINDMVWWTVSELCPSTYSKDKFADGYDSHDIDERHIKACSALLPYLTCMFSLKAQLQR